MRLYPSRAARKQAERRLRRAFRAGAAGTAITALAAGIGLVAAPAGAATVATPHLAVVGGNHTVTAAWTRVAGATGYTLRVSTARSLAHAKVIHTTSRRTVALGHLANGTRYYTSVTADGSGFGAAAVRAATASTTAGRGVPYPVTDVTARPGGRNQIVVSWRGGGRTTKVAVIGGSTSKTDTNHFATSWRPATTHTMTVTIPARLRSVLGAGTGNYVFVKVVQSNQTAANPRKHLLFDGADLYRLSPPGTATLAGDGVQPTDALSKITVASWNVQGLTASAGFSPADRWSARLPRVAANIAAAAPDVIGVQELGTARLDPNCLNHGDYLTDLSAKHCEEQYESLQSALSGTPLRLARSDAWHWVYGQPAGAYVESMLFVNRDTTSVLASGFLSPRTTLHVPGWGSRGDEAGMWARLRVNSSGREFLAASIHLPVGEGASAGALRKAEATALADYLDTKALQPDGAKLPIVLVGDLNSNGATEASAGSLALYRKGYFDAAATAHRSGARYSTSNSTNGFDGRDDGYPVHAVIHKYQTSRIDYVLLKNSPYTFRYQNLVRLIPRTNRFDATYQGSDHNLQLAQVGITDRH